MSKLLALSEGNIMFRKDRYKKSGGHTLHATWKSINACNFKEELK